jgi:hypothetical protein
MEAHRRLSRARRMVFWVAVFVYCTTLPLLVLDIFGISVRLEGPKPFLATGVLALGTRPEGADVRVDGRRAGRTPLTLEHVTPGEHRLEIRRPGGESWRGSVSIIAGRVTSIQDLPFAPAPPRAGRLATLGPPAVLRASEGSFYLLLDGDRPPQVLDLHRGLSGGPLLPVKDFPGRASGARTVGEFPGFLVETDGPRLVLVHRTLIGEWVSEPLPYLLPAGAPLLEATVLERSVTYLTAEAAIQRTPNGDRVLHSFHSPAWAWGVQGGRVMVLDRGGTLYQFGGLLPGHETALSTPPAFEAQGRIIAVRGGQAALLAGGTLYLADAKGSRPLGPAGGAADEPRRQRIVLWNDRSVGQLELRAIPVENPAEPRVEWLLSTAEPVLEVLPLQRGDGCLLRTRSQLLLACLAAGTRLEPIPLADLEAGAPPPVPDAAGYAVLPVAGGLEVLDVEAGRGEQDATR